MARAACCVADRRLPAVFAAPFNAAATGGSCSSAATVWVTSAACRPLWNGFRP